jgi:hypothetical protein
MSKLETPMTLAYWESLGGTLIEEFQMVQGDSSCGPRRADAVILPNRDRVRIPKGQRSVSVEGEDVIVVQAKAMRLGMYLMGQAVFSAELMKRFKPKSITSTILCQKDDAVLRPLLTQFPNVRVVVMEQFDVAMLREIHGGQATKRAAATG